MRMRTLRVVLGDQLARTISALRDLATDDVVLMVEIHDETVYVRHHQQKLILVLSAMRHFAAALRAEGIAVDYVHLDAEGNTGSFTGEVRRALGRHSVDRVVLTEPGEWRVLEMVQGWAEHLGVPVEMREDDRFLCSRADFAAWAEGRKVLRTADFYREMRRRTGWLMVGNAPADGRAPGDGRAPEGGHWSCDTENRKALPQEVRAPASPTFAPDSITREVMALVGRRFADHFGGRASFGWAVTREAALHALAVFVDERLAQFGAYQDAMRVGDDLLFHAALSPYLNLGLLGAREVCEAVLAAYQQGTAPLASVEGFVRQILGWREYVRGIYWRFMPDYAQTNALAATRPLPDFYWTGETEMACVRETIEATRRNAYAHHIQRLMVTGNFALLAGLAPAEVEAWYLSVYADAFEWVELPNTHGMALYADGGQMASKPYAASGAYIDRMSDACAGCVYDPKVKLGRGACPFNLLYWHFLMLNEALLKPNPRMSLVYGTLARMPAERRQRIAEEARAFLATLEVSRGANTTAYG
jgi:deoxyribodipyrimidine photolyase-related protein